MAQSAHKVLIIDNGSDNIKYGMSTDENPKLIGNYVVKSKTKKESYIGSAEAAKDKFGLQFRRPYDRGLLINWDTQKEIWDVAFGTAVSPKETHVLITEPSIVPDSVREVQNEMLFEEYGFKAMYTTSAQFFAMKNRESQLVQQLNNTSNNIMPNCGLVVDCGYSYTHIVPFFDSRKINYAIKRINAGGKVLTNYLKEIISFRHWNMMDEQYLINVLKEKLCYVSLDFMKDMELTKTRGPANTIQCEYVLPDYVTTHVGYIKEPKTANSAAEQPLATQAEAPSNNTTDAMQVDTQAQPGPLGMEPPKKVDEQILKMNNERITVPEILFNPSYVGIPQAGIVEAVQQSIECCPREIQHLLWRNIMVVGGSTQFKNFKERFSTEIRKFAPCSAVVDVYYPDNPITYGWYGGQKFSMDPNWNKYVVTKAEYQEYGHAIVKSKCFN